MVSSKADFDFPTWREGVLRRGRQQAEAPAMEAALRDFYALLALDARYEGSECMDNTRAILARIDGEEK